MWEFPVCCGMEADEWHHRCASNIHWMCMRADTQSWVWNRFDDTSERFSTRTVSRCHFNTSSCSTEIIRTPKCSSLENIGVIFIPVKNIILWQSYLSSLINIVLCIMFDTFSPYPPPPLPPWCPSRLIPHSPPQAVSGVMQSYLAHHTPA